jgi:hypothetical protein
MGRPESITRASARQDLGRAARDHAGASAAGQLANGLAIRLAPNQHALPATVAAAAGAPHASQVRPMGERGGRAEPLLAAMPVAHVVERAGAMGTRPADLARAARAVIRNPRLRSGVGALRMALACLDEDDDHRVAYLTPVAGRLGDADDLADQLARARDAEDLADLLADVLAEQQAAGRSVLPREPRALWDALMRVRHDRAALMDLLARAQGIPRPLAERQALRLQLENQLRELELSTEGASEAFRFRAADVAAKRTDPGVFLDTAVQLRASHDTWIQLLQWLRKAFAPAALAGALRDLVHVLGEEMAATRDLPEKAHLHDVTKQLQLAYKARSLLDNLAELGEQVDRALGSLPSPPPAAAAA